MICCCLVLNACERVQLLLECVLKFVHVRRMLLLLLPAGAADSAENGRKKWAFSETIFGATEFPFRSLIANGKNAARLLEAN